MWETCLAPGWPQLRSRLPFGPRSQASLQKAQGPGVKRWMPPRKHAKPKRKWWETESTGTSRLKQKGGEGAVTVQPY